MATGTGHTAFAIAPHVRKVIASDLTPKMLEEAGALGLKLGVPNVELRVDDVHSLPDADGAFQLVTCRRAAHHFSQIDGALDEMRRVLVPGGRLVIDDRSIPEHDTVDPIMNALDRLHDGSHVREYRPGEWRTMLEGHGFRVDAVETYQRHRPLRALTHDVFGLNLTSAIILTSVDLAAAKCQFLVANFVHKCFDTRLKRFERCKKRGMRGIEVPPSANLPLSSAEDIELCLGFDPAPRFLIAKFCNEKLLIKIQRKCSGNLDRFAGCGAPATDEDLRMCLDTFAKCRACLAVNEADALAIDCDLADDGNANSSCL